MVSRVWSWASINSARQGTKLFKKTHRVKIKIVCKFLILLTGVHWHIRQKHLFIRHFFNPCFQSLTDLVSSQADFVNYQVKVKYRKYAFVWETYIKEYIDKESVIFNSTIKLSIFTRAFQKFTN